MHNFVQVMLSPSALDGGYLTWHALVRRVNPGRGGFVGGKVTHGWES